MAEPTSPDHDRALDLASARRRAEEIAAAARATGPPALVPHDGVPAEVAKQQAAHDRAAALKARREIDAMAQSMRDEMERQIREMRALMAPLQEQVKRSEEVIWTMNLYLGRDEEIVRLLDGPPAPADTPITLRQQVLSMDEETAAFPESDGIDFRNVDVFDQWITDPEHLARVLPEQRGVVALVPRDRGRFYGDPWMDIKGNQQNRWTYFLIRNGENLYRMRTDFVVGKHLIPATDEFTGLFRHRDFNGKVRQIVPGTPEWDRAEKAQGARQRHYMRMALILQGLVDRTALLHPLPEGGVNLLDDATYAAGRATLLRDAENLLTDGREPFYNWLARLNKALRPGMRIMGVFNTEAFRDAGSEYRGGSDYSPNDRITPRARSRYEADYPKNGTLYTLDGFTRHFGDQGLTFKFERTTERWIGSGYDAELRAPKTRGTCVILPGDRFVLPFDLVTVEEMEYYLSSRVSRHAYADMMPLLHAAIAAKKAEEDAEAPFRALLAQQIVAEHGEDLTAATQAVPDLVTWWKFANRWHRPLVAGKDPKAEAKASRMILTEHARRRAAERGADPVAEADVVARLLEQDPTIMFVGRRRDGGYLAFAPQPRAYGEKVAAQDMWVREYTTTKTARRIATREWVLPGSRAHATRPLHTTDQWAAWRTAATATTDLTDPEIDAFVTTVVEQASTYLATAPTPRWGDRLPLATVMGVAHDPRNRTIEVYLLPDAEPDYVDTPGSRTAEVRPGLVRARVVWTKSPRGGAAIPPVEKWRWDTVSQPSPSLDEPWGPIHDGRSRHPSVVWLDTTVQDRARARRDRAKEYNATIRAARDHAHVVHRTLEDAWHARAEEAAHQRFIEDYGPDPALWEEHRKTLRLAMPSEYQWHTQVYPGTLPARLRDAIHTAVDEGLDIDGLTMAQVAERTKIDGLVVPDDLADLVLRDPAKEPQP